MVKETGTTDNYRNPDGTFATGNPGRPKGTLNFSTKWKIFINKIAEQNELKPGDIEDQLMMVAFNRAKSGDFSFWRDIHDRVYGKAVQPLEVEDLRNEQRIPTPAEKAAAKAYYKEIEKYDKQRGNKNSNRRRTSNMVKRGEDKKRKRNTDKNR